MFLYLSCLTPVGIANKNLGTVVSPFGAEAASAAKYFCFHLTVNDLYCHLEPFLQNSISSQKLLDQLDIAFAICWWHSSTSVFANICIKVFSYFKSSVFLHYQEKLTLSPYVFLMSDGLFSNAKLKLREGKVHLSQWRILRLDCVEMPTEALAFRKKM